MEKRNIKEVLGEIESVATIDVDIALSCFYVLFNDDGKPFVGISVRFAEIIASCWGNIDTGAKVVANDGQSLTVMGFVNDLEKNSKFSVQIQRRLVDFKGIPLTQEKVVEVTNAVSSIAFRNAIFKAIPAALFTTVVKRIKTFITDTADNGAIVEDAIKFFANKKVSNKDIAKRLEVVSLDNLDSEKTFLLIGLKNAVNEGDSTVEQAFGIAKKSARPSKFQFSASDNDSGAISVKKEEVDIPKEEVVSSEDSNDDVKEKLSSMNMSLDAEPEEIDEEDNDEEFEQGEPPVIHTRPKGRTPKGKKWDEVKGEFVSIDTSSE
jgi:copper chaperone CopZ